MQLVRHVGIGVGLAAVGTFAGGWALATAGAPEAAFYVLGLCFTAAILVRVAALERLHGTPRGRDVIARAPEGAATTPVASEGAAPPRAQEPLIKALDRLTLAVDTLTSSFETSDATEPADLEVGDHVVYPHHGEGQIVKREYKEILGESIEYFTIKIRHNDMTVMVAVEKAAEAGVRRVIDTARARQVIDVLGAAASEMPSNWNRRFKYNRAKIKSGDPLALAEVVRDLAIREQEQGLSEGERQMYQRARSILASELRVPLGLAEAATDEAIDRAIWAERAQGVRVPEETN